MPHRHRLTRWWQALLAEQCPRDSDDVERPGHEHEVVLAGKLQRPLQGVCDIAALLGDEPEARRGRHDGAGGLRTELMVERPGLGKPS